MTGVTVCTHRKGWYKNEEMRLADKKKSENITDSMKNLILDIMKSFLMLRTSSDTACFLEAMEALHHRGDKNGLD